MKSLILLVTIALVQADNLRPIELEPGFLRNKFFGHKPSGRITGGEEVEPHSIRYQAGLLIATPEGNAFCGGSLISPTTILTAAHCAEVSNNIEVVLGAHNIREQEPEQTRVNSSRIVIHPEWNRLSLINDIALIILADPVELNDNIQLVPLPKLSDVGKSYFNDIATASGWGKDSDQSNSISPVLRKVSLPVADNGVCGWYYLGIIKNTHICGNGDHGRSTCNGDSGGPLVASTGEQIGLTSFGSGLGCEIGFPPVFTRVTEYLKWIGDNSDVVIQ